MGELSEDKEMRTSMKIAVCGATGFIGSRLCSRILGKGHLCYVLSRSPERARSILPDVTEIFKWEATSELLPREITDDVDAVVNLIGEPIIGYWTKEKKKKILLSRTKSTSNIVLGMGLSSTPPEVFVCGSAVGYYGNRGEEELSEESAPGKDFLAGVCVQWEAEAQKAKKYGVRVVSIRTSPVLGSSGGMLQRMLRPFRFGFGGPLGSGEQWMPWIHLDDEIGLILKAIEDQAVEGPINAVAPEQVRNKDFTRVLGELLGKPVRMRMPGFLLKTLMGEIGKAMIFSQKVSCKKVLELGYRFKFPELRDALRVCLEEKGLIDK